MLPSPSLRIRMTPSLNSMLKSDKLCVLEWPNRCRCIQYWSWRVFWTIPVRYSMNWILPEQKLEVERKFEVPARHSALYWILKLLYRVFWTASWTASAFQAGSEYQSGSWRLEIERKLEVPSRRWAHPTCSSWHYIYEHNASILADTAPAIQCRRIIRSAILFSGNRVRILAL